MRISGRVDKSRNGRLRRAWLDCQPGQKERKREGKRERKKERKKKNDSFRWLVSARPIDRPSKSIRFYLMNRAEMKKNLFLFCAFFFGWLVCCFSFTIFFPVQVAPFFFFKKRRISKSPTIKTNEIPKKNSGVIEHFEGMNGEKKTKKESENDERLQ